MMVVVCGLPSVGSGEDKAAEFVEMYDRRTAAWLSGYLAIHLAIWTPLRWAIWTYLDLSGLQLSALSGYLEPPLKRGSPLPVWTITHGGVCTILSMASPFVYNSRSADSAPNWLRTWTPTPAHPCTLSGCFTFHGVSL